MANLNALIAQGAQFNLPNPVDQYSKVMQLQSAQQQMQMNRQQAQQIQEDRAGFAKLRETLAGKNLTPEDYEIALTQSPDPSHQKLGIEMRFKRIRLADLDKELGGGVKPAAEAPMAAPAEVPMAAPKREMFVTKDSSGRSRYLVDGAEVSPQEYQSMQSGVVAGAAPAARLNAFELPAFEPTNVLAAQVAPAAAVAEAPVGNAMAAKQTQIAEINRKLDVLNSPRYSDLPGAKGRIDTLERQLKQLTESPFAKPDTKDYTPASLAAFAVSGNYADLVPKAGKADKEASLFSTINPSDYTQDSVKAFAVSKNYGDLVPKAGKADSPISNVNPNDFTPASVQKFALSRNYGDLVLKPVDRAAKDDPTTTAAFSQVDAAGNVTFFNKFGNPISTQKGAGKPSATFEKTTAQRKQLSSDLTTAITELTDITKDGGLIDQSTGSGAGRLVDVAAGFGGIATPGAIAIGKLQPVADLVLKMVPRFEGPQSNADTTSYKQAAAQLADPTLPAAIRKEAGKTVLRLMIKRKGQFVTQSMADEGAGAGGGAPAVNVDALLDKYK